MIPVEYEAFEKVVTVGCANFAPVWGDKKRTLEKIEANVVEAAAQGIDIIAFPEESLTGTSACDACRAEGHACDAARRGGRDRTGSRHRPRGRPRPRARRLRALRAAGARRARTGGALQLGRGHRARGTARHVPQGASGRAAVGAGGHRVPAGHEPSGVPDALRADRRPDLLRLLVQPRAVAHPRVEGRPPHRQLLRDVRRPGQARLHGEHDERPRPGEPGLHGERQPRGRSRPPGLLTGEPRPRSGRPTTSVTASSPGRRSRASPTCTPRRATARRSSVRR